MSPEAPSSLVQAWKPPWATPTPTIRFWCCTVAAGCCGLVCTGTYAQSHERTRAHMHTRRSPQMIVWFLVQRKPPESCCTAEQTQLLIPQGNCLWQTSLLPFWHRSNLFLEMFCLTLCVYAMLIYMYTVYTLYLYYYICVSAFWLHQCLNDNRKTFTVICDPGSFPNFTTLI